MPTSRATVISAGYLRALPPYFRFHTTKAFRLYAMDLWMDYMSKSVHGHSSFASPGSSWAALFGEFGSFGIAAFVIILGFIVLRLMRVPQTLSTSLMSSACIAIIVLLCLVGYSRFYWEIPQAIFTPLLLCKLLYANAIHDASREEESLSPLSTQ